MDLLLTLNLDLKYLQAHITKTVLFHDEFIQENNPRKKKKKFAFSNSNSSVCLLLM